MSAPETSEEGPLIFVIAGEPSGDEIGGRLIAALRGLSGGRVRIVGIGGEAMTAEGLDSLFPIAELSVMGLVEVLPKARGILGRMSQTAREIRRLRPDAVVTIDAPGFASGVWRRLQGFEVPLVHYVAPTVWAWRPGRARKMARRIDHLLTVLPFEPPYFEAEGLSATFVGHPVLEENIPPDGGRAFRQRHGLGAGPVLGLLPGSRGGEIARLLPVFVEAAALMIRSRPTLGIVVPAVPAHADVIRAGVAGLGAAAIVSADRAERHATMAACDVAIAASGTVTTDLALCGVPMVVAYKVNPITGAVLKRMVRVRYATIINILLDRPAIPEFLLDACRPDALARAAAHLLDNETARLAQSEAARAALAALRPEGKRPSERAAEVVLEIANRARASGDANMGAIT